MNPTFELEHKDSLTKARACKIKTSHGEINTQAYISQLMVVNHGKK